MGALSHAEAKAFYDRLGRWQDTQAFYENRAIEEMLGHGRFETARAVCEFGCGTGALAERLLRDRLPAEATYLGLDVSDTMVRLAADRVRPWAGRARVERTDGAPRLPVADGGADRVVATYVLDLLSEADADAIMAEARRVLAPGGLFCNVSLTFGRGPVSRAICTLWRHIHDWRPSLLGGCRPVALAPRFEAAGWRIEHAAVVCAFGICSEVVVAAPRSAG